MTVFWAERRGDALKPLGATSCAALAKLPFGKELRVEVRQPRNARHHRKFWLLCERISEATGTPTDVVADTLKIESGHYMLVKSHKYGDLKIPRSIAWANMDQTKFNAFYDACIAAICQNWGRTRPEVMAAIEDLIEEDRAM